MTAYVLREVHLVLPMEPDIELRASEEASQMAASAAMSADRIDELRMAVIEACINALEHSGANDQLIYVDLALIADSGPKKIQVTVRDHGAGFSEGAKQVLERPAGAKVGALQKRGWGLNIIRGLMDELKLDTSSQGTVLVMSKFV